MKKRDVERIVDERLQEKMNSLVFGIFYLVVLVIIPIALVSFGIFSNLHLFAGMGIGIWLGALIVAFLEGLRGLSEKGLVVRW